MSLIPNKRTEAALLLCIATISAGVIYLHSPTEMSWIPPCLFFDLTGLYCPGCGTLRGLHQLLHGHLLAALRFNLMIIIAAPILVYCMFSSAYLLATGKSLRRLRTPAYTGWVIFGIIVAHMILRNIPIYPFSLLAPH